MLEFKKKNRLILIVSILLAFIPFLWLKPGEMDLGGDANRLYFYDPYTYLIHDGFFLYHNVLEGVRTIEPHFYNIPFVLLLAGIKTIIPSSYFLIAFINSIKLALSFLSIYLIIKTILKYSYKEKDEFFLQLPSIMGGLFYITAPIIIGNYDKALLSHNQVFLNPLIIYLLLMYFLRNKLKYLLIAIITSVIFAPSFSWIAAPPFFAFYPIALLFLLFYVIFILKKKIIYSHFILSLLFFIGLHAFHLIPEIYSLFGSSSYINERVFNKDKILEQLNYFYGVLPLSKLSMNILLYAPFKKIAALSFIPAFFIILGFILNKFKNNLLTLTGIFFLLTLYLVTANITGIGIKLYEILFYLPGFSMFRNFIGQWAFVFTFFYALLFGQAAYIVYKKIGNKSRTIIFTALISFYFIISAWEFFTGSLVNKTHFQSKNVKIAMAMDPAYEKTLNYIRSLKDGAFISFPFTDCCYSVVHGTNDGAYVGISPINILTGKRDYNGYIMISPFGEVFLKLAKEKDYDSINKLLGLLNVKYLFYNSDSRAYDASFPGYPYSTVRNYLPNSQKQYKEFIDNLGSRKIHEVGPYQIHEVAKEYYIPKFYAPSSIFFYKNAKDDWYGKTESFFVEDYSQKPLYIENEKCAILFSTNDCNERQMTFQDNPQITYEMINPTKYYIHVKDAKKDYVLAFSETYDTKWDVLLAGNGKRSFIADLTLPKLTSENQVLANGYANAWHIKPSDVDNLTDYTLVVEISKQKVFYISLLVSLLTLMALTAGGTLCLLRSHLLCYNSKISKK
jgi:hypothetical protein